MWHLEIWFNGEYSDAGLIVWLCDARKCISTLMILWLGSKPCPTLRAPGFCSRILPLSLRELPAGLHPGPSKSSSWRHSSWSQKTSSFLVVPVLWLTFLHLAGISGQFALQCHQHARISFKNVIQVAKIVRALSYLASLYYSHFIASSRLWGFLNWYLLVNMEHGNLSSEFDLKFSDCWHI